jgi:hypothetical protein
MSWKAAPPPRSVGHPSPTTCVPAIPCVQYQISARKKNNPPGMRRVFVMKYTPMSMKIILQPE